MKIRFRGEDGEEYDSWQELAKACPCAEIDPAALTNAQRQSLWHDFSEIVPEKLHKDGLEAAELFADERELDDPVVAFAAKNIRKLYAFSQREESELISLFASDAESAISGMLGGYHGLRETHLTKKPNGEWEIDESPPAIAKYMMQSGANLYDGARGDTLLGTYLQELIPVFTPLWHAIRTLYYAQLAKRAVESGNAADALAFGAIAAASGERSEFKAHEISVIEYQLRKRIEIEGAKQGGRMGGLSRREKNADRNEWLRQRAAELATKPNIGLNVNGICNILEKDLARKIQAESLHWEAIKLRAISNVIKPTIDQIKNTL